ncbi:hypothetical protein A9Q99_07065 [Gammaproteobacteria bacterium 45_16_T64]|nr:hypothetical protein A9Q99_07065 [Gammaproteobacteria bacterium 45_16_T64]
MKRLLVLCLSCFLSLAISFSAHAVPVKTDFVFIIDATGSMAGEIAGVKNGFSSFVSSLDAAAVDARFSIILFGGAPELVLDFTGSGVDAQAAFAKITIGANAGFQNNHNLNPEAGLEAIRIALGEATNNTLVRNNVGGVGGLDFRDDARKNLILVTDEDSDTPFYSDNRFGVGCNSCNPPSSGEAHSDWSGWQDEIDATAQAVIDNDAYLNMLINIGDSPTKFQYGDYTHDESDPDLLNWDDAATLANLQGDSATDDSLQTQVLEAGLVARTFNVSGANNADFVDNFFAAKLEEVLDDPGVDPIPEPASITLFGLGLLGLRLARRRVTRA